MRGGRRDNLEGREGNKLAISAATPGNPVADGELEVLISKSTWSLKLSGLIFAGLLVVGRSASYGNVTWTPTFHAAGSPLIVQASGHPAPAPAPPALRTDVAGAMSKPSAAHEVVVFNPGNSGDGQDGNNGSGGGSNHHDDGQGRGHGSGKGTAAT